MSTPAPKRPNVLLIVADDLGFSDIGCFGAEIETPSLDQLAKDGTRMLGYHTASACSPTRAMLMSGTDAHLGGLGCLLEYKGIGGGGLRYHGKRGYEGFLTKDVAALPEVLSQNDYFTMITGKWHLGLRPEYGPHNRGFQKSFSLLPGCCNHWSWEPQLEDGNTPMFGGRPIHVEDGKHLRTEPNKTENPEGFYSSKTYTDKFIEYMEGRTEDEKKKPFFSYLPYSAPHWPNQAPREYVEKYKDTYLDGPVALREKRLQRLVELGIISAETKAHEMVVTEAKEWHELDEYGKACSARSMAAYSGMVNAMDTQIGRAIDYLKQTGEYDNTFIVFSSDNGAEGAAYEALPVMGPKILSVLEKYYDNSLENIGRWNSYTWIGPYWAQASTAPSRLFKAFPSEGGILVPCIVKPAVGTWDTKAFPPGGFSRAFTTCMDIAPTVLDMLGVELAPYSNGDPKMRKFDGRIVHAMRGKSWIPYYHNGQAADKTLGEVSAVYSSDTPIGWELKERAALRKGEWKIVHFEKAFGGAGVDDAGWELFNVVADPGETTNLAEVQPDKFNELLADWDEYCVETGIVWGERSTQKGLPKEAAPLMWDDDMSQERLWMITPRGGQPTIA